jgi:hypothetical protein
MLPAHRAADEHSSCPGSGQRVTIDLTPVQWMENLRVAVREAAGRRAATVRRSGNPPVTRPVFRLAVAR